jgi:hypothetical protein
MPTLPFRSRRSQSDTEALLYLAESIRQCGLSDHKRMLDLALLGSKCRASHHA